MSDDLDFDMEIVENDELDELSSDGASNSEERTLSGTEKPREERTNNAGVVDTDGSSTHDSATGINESDWSDRARGKDRSTARISKEKIPDDWEAVQLGDDTYFQRFSGDTPTVSESEYWGGDVLWLSNSEVEDGRINVVDQTERSLTPAGLDECTAEIVPSHSVILSCTASIGKVAINTVEMATNQQFNSFKSTEEVNGYYLANQFLQKKPELETIGGATTHNHLPVYMLEKVGVLKPPLPEQRKIASVLYIVDQAIQKTEAIIEQAKRVKRGLIQDVLSRGIDQNGELRDPERDHFRDTKLGSLPGDWGVFPMGKTLETLYRYPSYYDIDYVEDGIPEVRGEMLRPDGSVDIEGEEIRYVSEETASEYPRVRLDEDDFVMSVRGTVGKVGRIPLSLSGGVITANLIRVKFDTDAILPDYAQLVLLSTQYQKRLDALTSATTIKTIKADDLRRIPIRLPSLDEQNRISKVVHSHVERIQNNKTYLRKLRYLKKGLMQDLLTGEVRTADKAIEILDEVEAHG